MNIDNEENENLIKQEPSFITDGDYPMEEPSEQMEDPSEQMEDPSEQMEDPSEQMEEPSEQMEEPSEQMETQSETQVVDYSEHFVILENLGYLQIVFLGTFLSYFVLTLVVKFLKSFF